MTPAQALDTYLSRHVACTDQAFEIQIDADVPKLSKHGTMTGIRLMSATGQVVYRRLRYTGDGFVKTNIIARYLTKDSQPEQDADAYLISRSNYSVSLLRTEADNGRTAYVYRLRPKHRREGLLKGELWLDAETGAPLRIWGDLVKSPSLFLRGVRVVRDYEEAGACSRPLRMLLMAQTRLAGEADLTVWWRPFDNASGASGE